MKYVAFVAIALIVACAEGSFIKKKIGGPLSGNFGPKPITGSYPGNFAPIRDFVSDYVTATPKDGPFTIVKHQVLKEPLIGQTITGHALWMSGAGTAYHTYCPKDKCPGVAATSTTAAAHDCKLATNAGFFDMDHGGCIGPIVSDGEVLHTASMQGAIFGITSEGLFAAGYANESVIAKNTFKQLVQGRGWLVHNGQSYLDKSANIEGISKSFINLIAPRLAIGWDNEGQLILVIVDGIEAQKKGIDLVTFTDMLIKFGMVEAVNLDGGGSVTFIWDGHYCEASGRGQEACDGNPTEGFGKPYERPVTSITCFK